MRKFPQSELLSAFVSENSYGRIEWTALELNPSLCGHSTGVDLLPHTPLALSLEFDLEFVLTAVVVEPLELECILSLDSFPYHRPM